MECREAARFVQLRLDDEIEPVDCMQLDRHLDGCPRCRDVVESELWIQSGVRAKLADAHRKVDARPPPKLRAQILAAANDEAAGGRTPVGRAFAACMAMSVVGAMGWSATASDTAFVEETVARHSRNLPPELRAGVADTDRIDRFLQRNLRYSVMVPRLSATNMPTRLVGARLSNIGKQDVAYMMYDHRGARVSLFAYPPAGAPVPDGFRQQKIGDRVVLVGQRRGYTVVSWRARDLEYSMVSNVDPGEMVHLASSLDEY